MTMTDPIQVAAGLVFRKGLLLITQRYPDAHLGGLWEFPGGKRDKEESFVECLERELDEELGIKVAVGERIGSITHHYPEKSVHIEFYYCDWQCHEPRPLGCHDLRWVNAEELSGYAFPEADHAIVERLRQQASLWHRTFP